MSHNHPDQIGNLGPELSSFVGRRHELRQLRRLLADFRLVTLTGVGGTGKTRLARHVAANFRRAFADGVWFVDLAELRDPGLLTQEMQDPGLLTQEMQDPGVLAFMIAATLRLRDDGTGSALRMLVGQLADRQMLLVLDNCEHLIPACAMVTDAVLRGGSGLKVLATSREPLAIAGEATFPVPPLSTPDGGRLLQGAELVESDAVALFVERARQTVPGFDLTAENQAAVVQICHRLDGLPLAIELAAARLRVAEPAQILERLTDVYALPGRSSRRGPARQQTLRACVNWSFDLCAKPERTLWGRASVFVGGFELDAAEGICADDSVPADEVLDLVCGLVDKSILIPESAARDAVKYRMLETIRTYGQDKLIEAGELAMLRRRHRDWYQQMVARARHEWVSDRQAYWLARLGREHANVRAAVEFCLAEPDGADAALHITTDLPLHYWFTRGVFGEGRRWVDLALTRTPEAVPLRARGLLISGQLAIAQADLEAGTQLVEQGEDLARRIGATIEIGHAAYIRGMGELFSNQPARAADILSQAWTILSAAREPDLDLDLHMNLLITLGVAAGLTGDQQRVSLAVREMRNIVESQGGAFYRAATLWIRAIALFVQGDLDQAAALAVENLRLGREWAAENPNNLAVGLEVLAWITAGQRQYRRAAVLLGAADTAFANTGSSIGAQGHFVGHHDACERQTRQVIGDKSFTDAFRQGQASTLDAVHTDVGGGPQQTGPSPSDSGSPLTPREGQVARLIAQGLSNRDIAATLVVSTRTAESHVEHILTKLGFSSRAQVAAWVAAQQSANPRSRGERRN